MLRSARPPAAPCCRASTARRIEKVSPANVGPQCGFRRRQVMPAEDRTGRKPCWTVERRGRRRATRRRGRSLLHADGEGRRNRQHRARRQRLDRPLPLPL